MSIDKDELIRRLEDAKALHFHMRGVVEALTWVWSKFGPDDPPAEVEQPKVTNSYRGVRVPTRKVVLAILRDSPCALTVSELVSIALRQHGHDLLRESVSKALAGDIRRGLVENLSRSGGRYRIAANKMDQVTALLSAEDIEE